ncbi:MAG: glycosyltransferase family 4 protein [Cytophaga sp.]|nr:glycosyltransferase family 4 protein [Undibacterium sp.]
MLRQVLHMMPKHIISDDIVVIDSVLPHKNPIGPRNSDFLGLINKLPNFTYYTMYPMQPGPDAWFSHGYGMTLEQFSESLPVYLAIHPQAKDHLQHLSPNKKYRFKLAYTYFLSETYTLLPFLEKNQIPFVFLLNPGGAFGLNNHSSDAMLARVCSSLCFRKVIVNQRLFQHYLIEKKLCNAADIIFDFSGSVQFVPRDVLPKRQFKRDKEHFDLCFVAAKYSEKGVDKGYDLFISAAKQLAKRNPDMRFHVVGGFDEYEIDVTDIKSSITFYGYLPAASLPEFYSGMDIYVSPNRPFKLYEGNSDGFPLAAGAMYCGVAGFNADELLMNTEFAEDEIVIIKTQTKDIVQKIQQYHDNLKALYALSRKGQKKAQMLYDIDRHIDKRLALFREIIETTR